MSVLTSVEIIVLSMLIMFFLQLSPAIFTIFLHYASAKYSNKKVSDLAIFYIMGVESMVVLTLVAVYTIVLATAFFTAPLVLGKNLLTWVLVGITAATGILFFWFYFRNGKGTQLFISRTLAKQINAKVKSVQRRSDAFCLGFISCIPELLFTIPIYLLLSMSIMSVGETNISRLAMVALIVMVNIVSLFIICILHNRGTNLAGIEKFREKYKPFIRFFVSLMYLLIAVVLLMGVIV